MKHLIILLLLPMVALCGRKYTSGGEMVGTNLNFPKMGANAVEGQGTTTFGGWGFGESDRTGHGHGAYGFFSNGSQRNYFDVRSLSMTAPLYARFWIKLGSNSNIDIIIFALSNLVDDDVEVIWKTSGRMAIGRLSTAFDSTSGVVTQSAWILVQLYTNWSDTDRVTINGETLIHTGAHVGAIATAFQIGAFPRSALPTNPGTQFSADDIAINDATGAFENGAPDDSAFVMWLPAVSDTASGNWVEGAGGTGALFDAVDNTPVTGAASETNTTNIKNTTSNASDNYDAAIKSYASAGVPSNKTVRIAQAVARHGEHSATGTESGGLRLLTNPTDAGETSFTFGGDAGAHGDDATTSTLVWRTTYGNIVYLPTITRTDRPTVRVGRRTANTNQICVDMLGVLIEVGSGASGSGRKRIIN